jgi:MFS family permease
MILCFVYGLTALDASVFAVLLPAIKSDFQLSDTELGFLSGISYAAFHIVFTVPIGLLADTWKRNYLIAISLSLFGLMTALCGFAANLVQLIVIRSGCALGASGTVPSSTSIIADLYPEKSRGAAMSLFVIGGAFGSYLAFALGGIAVEKFGWRTAIQLVALPSVLLGVITYFTVKEPPRGLSDGQGAAENAARKPIRQVFVFLLRQHSLWHLTAGATLVYLYSCGSVTWLPSYFQRAYGMGIAETGFLLGIPLGALSVLSLLAGGLLGDSIGRRDERWRAWLVAVALLIAFPFCVVTFLTRSKYLAIGAYAVPASLTVFYVSPTFALVQSLVPPEMRATALAIVLVILSVVGMGIGPQLVGLLSDLLRSRFGVNSLGHALLMLSPILLWAAAHFNLAALNIPRDLARVRGER